MTVDYDKLDDGIREVCRAINDAGFKTFASCEGGHNGYDFPWVHVHGESGSDLTKLIAWIISTGLGGCSASLQVFVQKTRSTDRFLRIEWWGHAPIDEWLEVGPR